MIRFITLMVCFMSALPAYSQESTQLVEVFVNKPRPNKNLDFKNRDGRYIEVVVYDLSGPEIFEEFLSQGLVPGQTQEQVTNMVMDRVGGLDEKYMEEHVLMAYQGLLKATQYEITKIPAVVFNNGESVIYGVSDIQKAILIHQGRNND